MKITREQFIADYINATGRCSLAFLLEYMDALPCDCKDPSCRGWAMVSKDPILRKAHMDLYAPKENER